MANYLTDPTNSEVLNQEARIESGVFAYLTLVPDDSAATKRQGALLVLNAHGEPVEFVCTQIQLLQEVLWPEAQRSRATVRRLLKAMWPQLASQPKLLLCRAEAVPAGLLNAPGGVDAGCRVVRVTIATEALPPPGWQRHLTLDASGKECEVDAEWSRETPEEEVRWQHLVQTGLVLEPFERSAEALRTVYEKEP